MEDYFDLQSNWQNLSSPSYVPPTGVNPAVVFINPNLDTNCENAAKDILGLIENSGFSCERPIDSVDLQEKIANIIKRNVSGNVNFSIVK
jgi:hypothetical protein